ncbi:MAG: hypothetical protein J6S67_19900 [Methanobrevibacter sp.]|nr:hypothetical protein [Methanobrevibacter sp.]
MRENYLAEAFRDMDVLDEDVFPLDDKGAKALEDFLDGDKFSGFVTVIDTTAETEEDLKDSYLGKIILDCCVCHRKCYKNKADIVLDDSEEYANVGEVCSFCGSDKGFKVVGEDTEYDSDKDPDKEDNEEEVETKKDIEIEDKFDDDTDSFDFEEKEEEKVEESLTEEVSKIDDIDAEADDKKENARKALKKAIDDADSDRDYRKEKGITRRNESKIYKKIKESRKPCKEDLSYGECATIEDEWKKFKEKTGRSDASAAWEFIETECKGVYDTDEEKQDVFSYISVLEEKIDEGCKEEKIEESVSAKSSARMKKKLREGWTDSKYAEEILNGFDFTDNQKLLDLVGRIIDRIDFSTTDIESEVLDTVRDVAVGYGDQWEILKEYSESPSTANYADSYNEFLDDVLAVANEIVGKNESLKEGKKLREAPNYELHPRYDARQSFYGKARVDTGDKGDKNKLYSYDTLVAEMIGGKPVVYGIYSATTLRHIKDWLKQNGFKAENKAQIEADYMTESKSCRKKYCKRISENWRGEEKIDMIWHGEWADPELEYKDHTFNYWDIEDALWEMFLEETGHKDSESNDPSVEIEFNKYIQDNAVDYLEDMIAFMDESKKCESSEKCNESYYDTNRVLDLVSDRTKARLKRIIDTQKQKYGNDMEIEVIISSPYKAHLNYGEGGADYTKGDDGKWTHDYGYIKIDSALADAIISDVCKAVGMCEKMNESVEEVKVTTEEEEVNVKTEDGKVTVETSKREDVEEDKEKEVIEPISDEVKDEIEAENTEKEIEGEFGDEVEVEVDDFDEESFDELGESYLKKAYSNVVSYKTSSAKMDGKQLVIEGVIKFKSGNEKNTSFVLESKEITKNGKTRFIGENMQICKGRKAFAVGGSVTNGKFISEKLNYDYRTRDTKTGKSKRVSGTVSRNK